MLGQDVVLGEQRAYMKESVYIYIYIHTSYTDALEGLRHDLAYMGTTTSVLQMQKIRC